MTSPQGGNCSLLFLTAAPSSRSRTFEGLFALTRCLSRAHNLASFSKIAEVHSFRETRKPFLYRRGSRTPSKDKWCKPESKKPTFEWVTRPDRPKAETRYRARSQQAQASQSQGDPPGDGQTQRKARQEVWGQKEQWRNKSGGVDGVLSQSRCGHWRKISYLPVLTQMLFSLIC